MSFLREVEGLALTFLRAFDLAVGGGVGELNGAVVGHLTVNLVVAHARHLGHARLALVEVVAFVTTRRTEVFFRRVDLASGVHAIEDEPEAVFR